MLDIKFIRDNKKIVQNACKLKNVPDVIDELLVLDEQVRKLKTITQKKTAEKNQITKDIVKTDNKQILIQKSKLISEEIQQELQELSEKEKILLELLKKVPQIPDKDAPIGDDDSFNKEVKKIGNIKQFNFKIKPHYEILDLNNWWNAEKITEICGSRTYCLKGEIAELDLAIQTYVIKKLINKGFNYIKVPSIVKEEVIFNAGHFIGSDKNILSNDVFSLNNTDKYLAGSSEIVINSLHSGEILDESILPLKYAGFSTCFRKEAGAAGKDTRGLIRFHEFSKVEQFIFCKKDQSEEMFNEILNNLCEFMEDFELPYRIIANSTGDMGFNKIKMNDVEAWLPSENTYREVGSCSSIGDFQARRTNTRYRTKEGVKFCYTLNNTGIALPRILAPFIENHQNSDGTVNIPKKLQDLMNGKKVIGIKG